MKNIIIAVLLFANALVWAPMAANADNSGQVVRCISKINSTQGHMTIHVPATDPDVPGWGEMVVGYNACKRTPGKDYVRVKWARYNFHPDHSRTDCDSYRTVRAPDGVRFKPYFWNPKDGRNYTRPAPLAKCRTHGTWTTGIRHYDGIWFHSASGPSKFRASLTGVVNNSRDTHDHTGIAHLWPWK